MSTIYRYVFPEDVVLPIPHVDPYTGEVRQAREPWTAKEYLSKLLHFDPENAKPDKVMVAVEARKKIRDAIGHVILTAEEADIVRGSASRVSWNGNAHVAMEFAEKGYRHFALNPIKGEMDGAGKMTFPTDAPKATTAPNPASAPEKAVSETPGQ